MKPRIYLETTVVSYLTAWPSRDLVTAAHQEITREWWQVHRDDFSLFVSQVVVQEASQGDSDAAAQRLASLKDVPILEVTEAAESFATRLLAQIPLPAKAAIDALHISLAVVHNMDYLLTWN